MNVEITLRKERDGYSVYDGAERPFAHFDDMRGLGTAVAAYRRRHPKDDVKLHSEVLTLEELAELQHWSNNPVPLKEGIPVMGSLEAECAIFRSRLDIKTGRYLEIADVNQFIRDLESGKKFNFPEGNKS